MCGLPASRQTNNKLKTLSAILASCTTFEMSAEHCVPLRGAGAGASLVSSCNK
jgi:hypothetical protein